MEQDNERAVIGLVARRMRYPTVNEQIVNIREYSINKYRIEPRIFVTQGNLLIYNSNLTRFMENNKDKAKIVVVYILNALGYDAGSVAFNLLYLSENNVIEIHDVKTSTIITRDMVVESKRLLRRLMKFYSLRKKKRVDKLIEALKAMPLTVKEYNILYNIITDTLKVRELSIRKLPEIIPEIDGNEENL